MYAEFRGLPLSRKALISGWFIFLASFLFVDRSLISNYLLWGGVLLPLLLVARRSEIQRFHQAPLVNAWLILMLYLLFSFFWSAHPNDVEFSRFLKRLVYLYGFFLATFIVFESTPALERELLRWAPIAIACAAAIQMVIFYRHHPFPATRMEGPGRLLNPIHFGVAAAAFSLAGLLRFREQSNALKAMLVVAAIINCVAIYLCQSRGALLAIALLAVFGAFFSRRFLPIALGALALCGVIALALDSATLFERGLSLRPEIWSVQLARFSECNWLIGCGVGIDETVSIGTERQFNPHSIYLGWLLYTGIIGLTGYVMLLAALLFQALRGGHYEWSLIALMGFGSTITAGDHLLVTPSPYWVVLLVPLAILLAKVASTKHAVTHST